MWDREAMNEVQRDEGGEKEEKKETTEKENERIGMVEGGRREGGRGEMEEGGEGGSGMQISENQLTVNKTSNWKIFE